MLPMSYRVRRSARPGHTPDPATLRERELVANIADARIWLHLDGELVELKAETPELQRRVVSALEQGLALRG